MKPASAESHRNRWNICKTRGLDERAAISMIVRGFLGANIAGLGPELDPRIAELTELAGHGEK